MTTEDRLTTPAQRDALRDAGIELNLLVCDDVARQWIAFGIFPGGSGDHRVSSPVGHGSSAGRAMDALLRMKVPANRGGTARALWALGTAVDELTRSIQPCREHVWYQCPQPCEKSHCVYCDGGLASCVVCNQAEGTLEPCCPGAPL